MSSYDIIRESYQPKHIKLLLIAESQPPSAKIPSSRHFYRSDMIRKDDRLFTNTIRALFPGTRDLPEGDIEEDKERWLRTLQSKGVYMTEALERSFPHEVTKKQRQAFIGEELPNLLERVAKLASPDTKIILIKSNVFDVAAEPLRRAGFTVLNTALVDYPGRFNQRDYREKLAMLASEVIN